MALFIVERVGTGFTVRSGENTLQAAASAVAAAASAAAAAAGVDNFFSTIADGVAGTAVNSFFASAESGATRIYKRTGTSPFYVDQGDAAAPATVAYSESRYAKQADLSANGGATLVRTASGQTVEESFAGVQQSLDKKRAFPRNNKVAFLGDSITAQGLDTATANETRYTNRGMQHWIPFLTSQRFVSSAALNFGVSGNTSAQIASRVGDVVTSGAGTCVVLAGTNDIGSLTYSQTTTNLATIYEALSKAGIYIIALPILPRTLTGEANYSFPQRVNEWIAMQGQNYAGFKYIDPFLFGDPYSLTYSPNTGYTYDGLHPMAIGAFTLSDPVAAHLNTILPFPGPAIRSVCDYWNTSNPRGALNVNPLLGGTGGVAGAGVTGSIADSHRVQAFENGGSIGSLTVACSKSAATLTGMVNQRIVIGGTATGGWDTSVILDCTTALTNIAAGDVIELIADVEIPGATIGISGIEAYLAVEQNGVYKWVRDGYPVVSDDYIWKGIPNATFRTPPLALSGTLGGDFFGIKISLKNTGTTRSCDVRINNLAVRKVV